MKYSRGIHAVQQIRVYVSFTLSVADSWRQLQSRVILKLWIDSLNN